MKTKHYLFAVLAACALLTGCYDDDKLWKAVHEQQQRIEALEAWQKTANSNIEALQALVSGKHFITDVIPVVLAGDTTGYTITFHDRTPVTIYNGEKGEQGPAGSIPAISLTQGEDGNWYWTLNGTLMKDAGGNLIPASGPVPKLNTGQGLTDAGVSGTWTPDAIYLSVDDGKTWTAVSGTSENSFFSYINVSDDDYVIFTLAGGTVVKVPRYQSAGIKLTPPDTRPGDYTTGHKPIPWNDPWLWGSSATVTCRINYPAGSTHRVEIIAPKGWKTMLNTAETELIITAPGQADLSTADYEGKIILMLHVDNNPAIIRTLDVKLTDAFIFSYGGQIMQLLNHYGYKGSSLTIMNGNPQNAKMSQEDFDALKANTTIHALDLRELTDTVLPDNAFYSNMTLQTILLPPGLTTIGKNAFARCLSLREIEIPQKVKIIPPGAFSNCSNLQKVTLPDGLEEIQGREGVTDAEVGNQHNIWGAFNGCPFLSDITIPSTCKKIGVYAFEASGGRTIAQELTLPENSALYHRSFLACGMTKLTLNTTAKGNSYTSNGSTYEPEQIFRACWKLKEVVIGEGVTRSPGNREDFRACTELETVRLPSTFTTLHPGMFAECTSLKTIIWPLTDPNAITIEEGPLSDYTQNAGPFHNASPDFKIYVPSGQVEAMKSKFPTLAAHFFPIQ